MHIWGHELEIYFLLLRDGTAILLAGLIVHDLEVNFVASLFDVRADVVVYHNAMAVLFGSEGLYKDDISAAVVSQHNM